MALVIGRKSEEGVRIGDIIRIQVVRTRKDTVRLIIDAPPEITVVREEVYEGPAVSEDIALKNFETVRSKELVQGKPGAGA